MKGFAEYFWATAPKTAADGWHRESQGLNALLKDASSQIFQPVKIAACHATVISCLCYTSKQNMYPPLDKSRSGSQQLLVN